MGAVKAVFRSWDNPRANIYRRDERHSLFLGHCCQRPVHGLRQHGRRLRHRRCFHPQPGHRREEAVRRIPDQRPGRRRGGRRPYPHAHLRNGGEVPRSVTPSSPRSARCLESHYHDMQDMEFTVEAGKLYMLQTRNGKRTAPAALKIACDLVDEGMIDEKQAVAMIEPRTLDTLLHPQFDAKALKAAQPVGRASGRVSRRRLRPASSSPLRTPRTGLTGAKRWFWFVWRPLLRTSRACMSAQGILTVRGGMTSHAAVVARGMGTLLRLRLRRDQDGRGKQEVRSGAARPTARATGMSPGRLHRQHLRRASSRPVTRRSPANSAASWAGLTSTAVCRCAPTPTPPVTPSRPESFGAEGIGLCRTEHMFFEEGRIAAIREMICSDTVEEREAALAKILPMQQADFEALYEAMEGLPRDHPLPGPPAPRVRPQHRGRDRRAGQDAGQDRSSRSRTSLLPCTSSTP